MTFCSNQFIRAKRRWRHTVYMLLFAAVVIHVFCRAFGDGVKRINNNGANDVNVYKSRRLRQASVTNDVYNSTFHRFLAIWGHHHHSRHRNNSKCFEKIPDAEFPPDFLTKDQRQHGGILLHLMIATYACIALGIVCDYYFVPSLEIICYHLHIQEDVGGATLMCMGSSLPDITASIMAVMFVDGELGVGTVMGTTVFNLLLVVGVCGLLAYENTKLTWWPLVRDMTAYCISIIALGIVMIDKKVSWNEAAIMVCLYGLYMLALWMNKPIEMKIYLLLKDRKSYEARFEDALMKKSLLMGDEGDSYIPDDQKEGENVSDISSEDYDYCGYPTDPPDKPFELPECNVLKIISWVVVLPIKAIFFLTIPDLRRPKCQKLVAVTFLVGMLWIGICTYLLLWMVTIMGQTMGIPGSLMGVTFVTFGTSVPDLLCSVVVMRRDKADMALSQAIAANPLGILIGLGLPWLIKSASSGKIINIDSDSMLISCAITFVFALLVLLIFYVRKFRLDKKIGVSFVAGYVLYLIGSIIIAAYVNKKKACKH